MPDAEGTPTWKELYEAQCAEVERLTQAGNYYAEQIERLDGDPVRGISDEPCGCDENWEE